MDIGSRAELSFSIGNKQSSDIQVVDIWVGSTLITYVDNAVYLPAFIHSLKSELNDIENGIINREYLFFDHGPSTDDVLARAEIKSKRLLLNCELDNGTTVTADIAIDRVIAAYRQCLSALDAVETS